MSNHKSKQAALSALRAQLGEERACLVSPLVAKTKITMASKVIVRDPVADIHRDLESYCNRGAYHGMVKDGERNTFFEQSIKCWASPRTPPPRYTGSPVQGLRPSVAPPLLPVSQDPVTNWLEIGPGLEGTLTTMVLEANPRTSVTAVEAVENIAVRLHRKLQKYSNRVEV